MTEKNRFSGMMGGLNSSDKKALIKALDEAKEITEAEAQRKPKTTRPAPKSKSPDYVQLGIYLPKELHRKMKIASAMDGQEMSAIAAEGIRLWLEKNMPNI